VPATAAVNEPCAFVLRRDDVMLDTAKFVVVACVVVEYVEIRFGNVLFAVVVAVKYAATVSPTTESFAYGEVVPMPTLLAK
jgi:hypothetical protein